MWHGNNTAPAVRWFAKEKKKKQGVKRKECVREWIRMRGQRGLCQHRTCLTACSCCGSAGRTRFQILKSLCGCVLTIRPYHACYIQLASSRLWQVHNFFFLFVTSTSDCWLQIKSNKVEAKYIYFYIYTGGNISVISACTLTVQIHHGKASHMSTWRTHGRWQLKRTLNIYLSHICVCESAWQYGLERIWAQSGVQCVCASFDLL